MKGQAIEIIKELIVSILIVAVIGIVLSIVFYKDIAIGKVIPKAENYILADEMQNEFENTQLKDAEEIVVNYHIDASDLKKYEKTNKYVKGKSNPFAEFNPMDNNGTSSDINNDNGNGGFYEDDGTK